MVSKRTKNSWAAYKPRGSPGPAAAEQRRGEAGGTGCLPLPQPHRRPRGVSVAPPRGYVRVLPRPPAPVPLPHALTRLRLAHRSGTGRGAAAPCPRARPPRPSSCSAGASPRRCGGLAAVGGDRPSSGVRRRSAGRDSLRSLLPPYLTARADLTADGKRGNRQPQPAPCRSRTAGPRRVTLAARQRRFKVGYLRWMDETCGIDKKKNTPPKKNPPFLYLGTSPAPTVAVPQPGTRRNPNSHFR